MYVVLGMQDLFKITFLPIGQRQLARRCGSKTRLLPVFFALLLLAKKRKKKEKKKQGYDNSIRRMNNKNVVMKR